MFVRPSSILFSVVSTLVLAGVAFGAPADIEVRSVSQCNTGSVHCCDSTMSASSFSSFFPFFGIPMPAPGTLIGSSCSPTTVGGIGSGAACTQQPVCCTGVAFSGAMNVGCSPITINL